MSGGEVYKVAAGRAWRMRCTDPEHSALKTSWEAYLPNTASRVHLTDGTPNSRTGRNVRALCGATCWPNRVAETHPAPTCAECRRTLATRAKAERAETLRTPHHGDGRTYSGECLCHGVIVTGRVARSRPDPYLTTADPLGGGRRFRAVLLSTDTGAHDVPLAGVSRVATRDLTEGDKP